MRLILITLVALTIGLDTSIVFAQAEATPSGTKQTVESLPAWRQALIQRQESLIATNGTGTNEELKQELLSMWVRFESTHTAKPGENITHEQSVTAYKANESLQQELASIVEKNGWPTISMVGFEASNHALKLLASFHDVALREQLLPQLEELAKKHKIAGAGVAGLVDQDLVAKGQKQRYGTLFRVAVEDKTLTFINIENLAGLDDRRSQMGLPPMAEFKQAMASTTKMSVSEKFISPQASKSAGFR